jgi:hypothetical protein
MLVDSDELSHGHEDLARIIAQVVSLRATLENHGESLRLEIPRVFEKDILNVEAKPTPAELAPQVIVATATLRAAIHHAVRGLCTELRPDVEPPELASGKNAMRAASERLRREVWIFAQDLRAFLAKAKVPRGDPDSWEAQSSFHYVREFLRHFHAMGYQLVRSSDYSRLDGFLDALQRLGEVDLLDASERMQAIEECAAFFRYLEDLFKRISKRTELEKVPFDKQAAAETLRIYLGAV